MEVLVAAAYLSLGPWLGLRVHVRPTLPPRTHLLPTVHTESKWPVTSFYYELRVVSRVSTKLRFVLLRSKGGVFLPRGPRPSLRTRVGRLRRLLRHRQLRRDGKPLRHEGHPRPR